MRREAAWALATVGPEARVAVAALTHLVRDPDMQVRKGAVRALGQLGAAAGPAVAALVEALTHSSMFFCRQVASALARIGSAAVPALTGCLRHASPFVRHEAAWALGQIGPRAAAAEEALLRALTATSIAYPVHPRPDANDPEAAVPTEPARPRNRMEPEEAVRVYAAQALGRIGARGRSTIAGLMQALDDGSVHVRQAAAQALATLLDGHEARTDRPPDPCPSPAADRQTVQMSGTPAGENEANS